MKFIRQSVCLSAALAAAVAVLSAGCSKQPSATVLATVGDRAITTDDFKAEMQYRLANRQPLPDRATLLEQMVTREALVQSAKAQKLDRSVELRRTYEDMLIAKLKDAQLEAKLVGLKVSEDEIKAEYERGLPGFTKPAKVQLAFILVGVDAKASSNRVAEAQVRITEARQMALALPATTKSFATLAMEYSEDQLTRYRGGDGGWFTPGLADDRWPEQVIQAGFALKPGEVSEPMRGAEGFYLVKKMDFRDPVVTPLAQVRPAIERRLLATKREQAGQDFITQFRKSASVQTHADLLAQIDYPTQKVANTEAVPPGLPSQP